MRKSFLALVFLVICPFLVAQQTLNNEAIIKLVKVGLSDDLIVSTINAQTGSYDTSTDGLIALKGAGVSDRVVSAMVAKAAAPAPVQAPAIPLASPAAVPPPVPQAIAVQPPAPPPPPPPPPFHSTDGKIRIYVTDHPIFESNGIAQASGNRHGGSAAAASHTQSGDDPRVVEVEADMRKVCPAHIVPSNNPDRSDLVLVFRRRGGERSSMFAFGGLTGLALSAGAKVDGASLFQADGDMVYATKKSTVENAIKDVCDHIPAPTLAPAAAQAPSPALAPIPPPPPPSPAAAPTAN
jgi:hypothetical protein